MNLICKLTDTDIGEKYIETENPQLRLASRGIVIRYDGKIAVFNKSNKIDHIPNYVLIIHLKSILYIEK